MTETITQIEKAEFDLVAALAEFRGEKTMRDKALALLAQLREIKKGLLARSPDVLRKASAGARRVPVEPRWFGLPCVEPEVCEMVKAARDRQSEERRLSKAYGRTPAEPNDTLKRALRQPITGDRGLINFLTRRAGR